MERIGVRELRQHASRYLDRVKHGETVEVTERGTLVALLVPPTAGVSARDRLVAGGSVRPATATFQLPRRSPLPRGGRDTASVLDDLRVDER